MDYNKLKVDHQIHIDAGMRILTEVKGLRSENHKVKWPVRNELPFEPKGVTLEEAQKVMRKL